MNMSLLKIPLLLLSAIAVHVSITAPHHPSSDEIVHKSFVEWVIVLDVKYGLPITKAVTWAITLAEIAITASHAIEPSALPSVIQQAVNPLRGIQDVSITSPVLLGTTLVVAGGFIRWWCFRTLGRFFTFKLSVHKGHQLVTTGMYAVVRHPAYAGTIIRSIGMLILYGSSGSLLRRSGVLNIPGLTTFGLVFLVGRLIAVLSLVGRISHEEEVMKSISRDEWEGWAKAVRYRLIPGIY
ncbi:hypothetical protein AZE42_04704 [Rhizopogon vesiculosus]|uniref:Protein-S-isoprenylcysteine O-methyltransferase n=1 Tax=Rhizopogon vesiculosus TaxID=180088 RepID=A0A1J8PUR0_9AGAM|nr:hypothetical protein AZE42_04704 [Rhizopogon vesiculosus]